MDEEMPMQLTNAQWAVVRPSLSGGKSGPGQRGRPRRDDRLVLEGVPSVLRADALERHTEGDCGIPDVPPTFHLVVAALRDAEASVERSGG